MKSTGIQDLLEKLAECQPGPTPSFTSINLLELILYLGRESPVGRKRLSSKLELGEGVVRNMLTRLEKAGIIKITKEGCVLTREGLRMYEEISSILIEKGQVDILVPWSHPYNYVVVLKKRSHLVKIGLEQRDAAIRAGADAAMVMTYVNNELHMPGVSILSIERPDFASEVIEKIKPEEGDVIIIAGAKDYRKAKYGALAAAQTIL